MSLSMSPPVVALLAAADQTGCLVEALSFCLGAFTQDGASRLGDNLYNSQIGLMRWGPDNQDDRWDVYEKVEAHILRHRLRADCQDDVDFVLRLLTCFRHAAQAQESQQLAEARGLNQVNLFSISRSIDKLMGNRYARHTKDQDDRGFDALRVGQLRRLLCKSLLSGAVKLAAESLENNVALPPLTVGMDAQLPRVAMQILDRQVITDFLAGHREDTITVKVKYVLRDPIGRRGVVILETESMLCFPAPFSAISLNHMGPEVEHLKGLTLTLDIIRATHGN